MTQRQRRALWTAVHRYLGLAAMLFLFVAAVTGCLLCFHKPLDAALNADLFRHGGGANAITPLAAVTAFQAGRSDLLVTSFPLSVSDGSNIPVAVAARSAGTALGFDQIFLDGRDGHVVGTRRTVSGWDRRHIMHGVFEFHFTLVAGKWGRWLMGTAALGWLIGNLVGVYLTWPLRRPWLQNWKRMWRFSFASVRARFMLDLHRSSGLWLLIGVSVLAFTSVTMNFFDEAFTPAVNAVSPARPSPFDEAPRFPQHHVPHQGFSEMVDRAVARAAADRLDWKPAMASYVPDYGLFGVSFTASGVENYSRLGPITYFIGAPDGQIAYVDNPYIDSAGRKLTRVLYPLHSGEVGGVATIALVFLLGLATAEMCVTGFYVYLKKRRPRRAGRRSAT